MNMCTFFNPQIGQMYVLEAQMTGMEGFVHIGYMKKIFSSKRTCAEYYDEFHPHMRSLAENQTWASALDDSNLRYVVRRYEGEYLNLEPFGGKRRMTLPPHTVPRK